MENRKRRPSSVDSSHPISVDQDSNDCNIISVLNAEITTKSTDDEEKLSQESAYLTNLDRFIPELAWKIVLEKLITTSDIENCSNSSPYFGLVLKKKRENKIVLPKIFDILGQRYFNQKDESYKETSTDSMPWQKPLGNPDPHKMTGFWKCRLICKSWNKAIQDLHKDKIHVPFYLKDLAGENFESHKQAQKFILHFDPSHYNYLENKPHKNPFLGHNVRLVYRYEEQENVQIYNERILKIINNYGQYIWHLELSYLDTNSTVEVIEGDDREEFVMRNIIQFYRNLREMLLGMPNLKDMSILYFHSERFFSGLSPQQLQTLKLEISRNLLPKLVYLKHVTTHENIGSVFNELLHQNRHIESLFIVNIKSLFTLDSCGPFIESLTNLQNLSIRFYTLEDFEHFQTLRFIFRPKRVCFEFLMDAPVLPWSSIFKVVEAILDINICTDLSLDMPKTNTDREREMVLRETLDWKLNLPNIENIKIWANTYFSLDFLLNPSSSLKQISINKPKLYENEFPGLVDNQVIQYLGYENQLQNSNIWKLFPKLETVVISHDNQWCTYSCFGQQVSVIRG